MIKICYGCGLKLQTENKEKKGFIPPNKYNDSYYCQRCYRIMHYGKIDEVDVPKENINIIKTVNKSSASAIFLIDFLNINQEVLDLFKAIKIPKTLVISKSDTIPNNINDNILIKYIKKVYSINDDIRTISSIENKKIDSLFNYLYNKKDKEIYVLGLSNSGKSTLINKIIKKYNINKRKITTSKVPNTTREFIRVKIDENLTLVDSPGFVINSLNFLYEKRIKEKIYQMKKNEILRIDDIYIKFKDDVNIKLYLPENVYIKKHFKEKDFHNNLNLEKNNDLVIKGLGFIHFNKDAKISMTKISNDLLEKRKSVLYE